MTLATALIAARMGSSRLPGKTMMPVMGRPMIEQMIERIRKARTVGQIVVATTELPEDDELAALIKDMGVGCYRGSVEDVLGRTNAAAAAYQADLIVQMLGDNPLVHAELIDDAVDFFQQGDFDYVANVTMEHSEAPSGLLKFPVGIRVEVFTAYALARCAKLAQEPEFREHSTSFIYEHPDVFRLGYMEAKGRWQALNRPQLTFAVNYEKNLELVRRIFETCSPQAPDFTLFDVVRAVDADPALKSLMGNVA